MLDNMIATPISVDNICDTAASISNKSGRRLVGARGRKGEQATRCQDVRWQIVQGMAAVKVVAGSARERARTGRRTTRVVEAIPNLRYRKMHRWEQEVSA